MKVHVLHNNTKTPEGSMAIYDRMGEGPRTLPGDTLTYVGTLDVPEVGASDWSEAADITFEAGNSPHESERMMQYRSWQVRSLCVGDVLVFRFDDGGIWTAACAPAGWESPLNLNDFTVENWPADA